MKTIEHTEQAFDRLDRIMKQEEKALKMGGVTQSLQQTRTIDTATSHFLS
jgi:hypothetical protein